MLFNYKETFGTLYFSLTSRRFYNCPPLHTWVHACSKQTQIKIIYLPSTRFAADSFMSMWRRYMMQRMRELVAW